MRDFITSDEEAAFNDIAASESTGSTKEDIREVWFTARSYFSHGTEKTEDGGGDETQSAVVDDSYLRQMALQYANQSGLTSESTVARAEAFLTFLKGGA